MTNTENLIQNDEVAPGHFVQWEDRYSVGIPAIDEQHKKLIDLTNDLYDSCIAGTDTAKRDFGKALHAAVDYVRVHFSFEEAMLKKANYPYLEWHKKQHGEFVQQILQDAKDFDDGQKFVPNKFVRFLRDWILSHIAMVDKSYSNFILKGNKTPPPQLR
ncbi:MAG: bacteriohemerythrin [Spirochaetaceae bacterium]|jgi:hemerythrin|nr:bacteriohemerythrin [Spirochaetaceae bacterium]